MKQSGSKRKFIQEIAMPAIPDVAYRIFDNGVVLANPPLHLFTFGLTKLAQDFRLRGLIGTAMQDTITNSGQPVREMPTIARREGLFLQLNDELDKQQ